MLSKSREVRRRGGDRTSPPVAGDVKIFKGGLVVLEGGFAKPAYEAANLTVAGVAENTANNLGGANGAIRVDCLRDGWFHFENDNGDPVSRADINSPCYIIDDETIARTDGGGSRSKAGILREIEGDLIYVEFE